MLPHSYELPAGLLLVIGGALSCFAGFRLFKIILGIYGFILGGIMASSIVAPSNTVGMVAAAIVGGLVGALALMFAFFVGVALLGAALGALVVAPVAWSYVGSGGDPAPLLVILLAFAGSLTAMLLQRYTIIVATAFFGAWALILGGVAIGDRGARAASVDVWILYPMSPAPGRSWVPIAWVGLGLIGTAVQLSITGRKK
jgi:uncharacterized protein DUF4203